MIERVFRKLYNTAVIRTAKKQGMKVGKNVRFLGNHNFGSEPFLIEIGDNVTVSSNVTFVNHDGGTTVFKKLYEPQYEKVLKFGKIIIHDNCFIGTGTIIMPGVEIGPNAVIGAGSIVTKNVEPETVVAGTPIRTICSLEEYALKSKKTCPDYNYESYRKNKRTELMQVFSNNADSNKNMRNG